MKQLLYSMSIASALGFAACGGSQTPEPTSPSAAQMTPSTTPQYGATMSQPSVPSREPTATGPNSSPAYGPSATIGSGTHAGSAEPQNMESSSGEGAGGEMSATSGSSMDVANLDDAQVAAVLQAMNSGEIQQAQLADKQATSSEVKRFAQKMLMAHREMQGSDATLFSRLKLTPRDNTVSNQLKTDAQSELSNLRDETSKNFDRDYIDGQVSAHRHALELIDRMLMTTRGPELRTDLQNARPKVEDHLRDAERIQQNLVKGPQAQPAPTRSIPAPTAPAPK